MQVNETKLLNELTYQAYLLNRDQVWKHLSGLGLREYIALRRIQELGAASDIYSGRVFLKEFAENMRLTIRQTSRLAGELKGRGLIRWEHDGSGSEGTYFTLTEQGKCFLAESEEKIRLYFGRVIAKFGQEKLIDLLHRMKELDTVMQDEFEAMTEEDTEDV